MDMVDEIITMTIASSKVDQNDPHYVFAADLSDIQKTAGGCLPLQIQNHSISLFYHNSKVYAIDNRCPHMGFPLHRGTVKDGILTCHWHHARFDLLGGGTFDQWAGDVRSFPVQIRNGNEIWVSLSSFIDPNSYNETLLQNALKQNISLMIAKAVIAMSEQGGRYKNGDRNSKDDDNDDYDVGFVNAFCTGLDFGTHYKQSGWGQGLTILTGMMNISRFLDLEDKPYSLYHGLSAVAQDCVSMPPRFQVSPLPDPWPDLSTLKRWFRQFIESRDAQAAERCIVTVVRLGANSQQLADMFFAAVTDHRFLDVGHTLDFTNKAFEALDTVGWDNNKEIVESVLSSLVLGYTSAERMEESDAWRHPIDLIAILEDTFSKFPFVLENVRRTERDREKWNGRDKLVTELLGDDPQSIVNELLDALNQGATEVELASAVAYAAALRIAQFHTRNEFSDWDAALHTFTFANAVHQGLRRISTPELLRGVFDGAMRIYLNRFLNIPPAKIPKPRSLERSDNGNVKTSDDSVKTLLRELPAVLDKQQQINQAGQLVADYIYNGGNPDLLLAMMGNVLLREDRNFHSIQMVEAAFRQYSLLPSSEDHADIERVNILVAAARYLAAHSPTMRTQGRTYQIANQLYHGEHLFEE
jgi:nitrite reductase/ring-hydroxylating ferredoxin subunit